MAKRHEALYRRFKADEASQEITGPYRRLHPEDNNERQAIHEHVSGPIGGGKREPLTYRAAAERAPRPAPTAGGEQ
jgi:hypothetical protein